MIRLKNVTKKFQTSITKSVTAVKDLSLEVNKGDVFGLLGPNGSGKTTTLKLILGLVKKTSGDITIMNKDPMDATSRKRIGYLPENPYFYSHLNGIELLRFAADLHGMDRKETDKRANELLELVSMKGKEKIAMKNYSKGMLQRIGLAQALINNPDLVLLDEPMSGLDPLGRYEVKNIILNLKKEGKTIFFCSHILSDVEDICTDIAIIVDGKKIIQEPIKNITKNKKNLEEYFIDIVKQARS